MKTLKKSFSSSIRNVYSWFLREETQGMCLEEYLFKQGTESTTNSTTFSYDASATIQTKESWEARALNNVPSLLLFIHRTKTKLRIRLHFHHLAPWKQRRGMGTHMLMLPNNLLGRIPAQCPNWSISWSLNLHLFFTALNKIQRNLEIIRDLKIEVFRHFPRTVNIDQEVTWWGLCRQVCGLRFTFVRLNHAPVVSDLPQGFLHPKKSQPHVWEEIQLFRTLCLLIIKFYFKKTQFWRQFRS